VSPSISIEIVLGGWAGVWITEVKFGKAREGG